MPPTKSNAGKAGEPRGRMGGAASTKGPVVQGMKGRMGCVNGMKGRMSGMKSTGMKVTGMKGRMGPNRAGLKQQSLNFKAVKGPTKKRAPKRKISPESILSGNKQQDEALLKLRIPLLICSSLPSIKKFTKKAKGTKGQKKVKNMTFETVEDQSSQEQAQPTPRFGCTKKKKSDFTKYTLSLVKEHRFQGMIWDVAFTEDGHIVVTCSEGAMLCDKDLKVKKRFENMFLPGAIDFFSDGRILIVDRSSDTVNVYRKNATFIRSFLAGKCPMGMVVTENDEVLVSDTGDKCVRKFDMLGRHLMTIPSKGENYAIQWPLYLSRTCDNDIVVSDVHQQKVLTFSKDGTFQKLLSLKTQPGSSVLRPHGVCTTKDNELFVIDTSIASMESFHPNGSYMQTVLLPDDGLVLEPKLCKLSPSQDLVVIGGMKGLIRIYQLVIATPKPEPDNAHQQKATSTQVKKEVKQEPMEH